MTEEQINALDERIDEIEELRVKEEEYYQSVMEGELPIPEHMRENEL